MTGTLELNGRISLVRGALRRSRAFSLLLKQGMYFS